MNFGSYSDPEVGITVGLVNALTGPGADALADAQRRPHVAAVLAAATGRSPRVDRDGAERLYRLAGQLRVVFERAAAGDIDACARRVNALLAEYRAAPQLIRHDDEPWHVHFHSEDAGLASRWGATCATALAVVLSNGTLDRLGICPAAGCQNVYVDVSRNGSRRFCSGGCLNRTKVSAFRARQPR